MTISKVNGFSAPYRSLTFRKEKNAIIKRNGLLSIDGKITESGANVTIPPMSFLQNGMVVIKDVNTIVPKPSTLVAPYYVTVSAQSSMNIDDLSFRFVKSPTDITEEVVILGEFDGTAWRNFQIISNDGVIEDINQAIIDTKKIGPYEGLLTSSFGPNFLTSKGLLYDVTGERILFENDVAFPTIPSDADPAWKRVDRILYRRPLDDKHRIGVRSFLTGGTFTSGPKVINNGDIATSISPNGKSRSVISSDNSAHVIYANGFGSSFSLNYKKLATDRTTITATSTIIPSLTTDDFDVAINNSNQIYLTFISNDRLFMTILDSNGATVVAPFSLESLPNPCSNPRVVIDTVNTKVFISFEYTQSVGLKQIYITTRTLGGALVKDAQRVTTTILPTINQDMYITSDLLVHLTYESNGDIFFKKLDDNFADITSTIQISTSVGSSSFGILNGNSKKPQVRVSDNMEVFVSFLIRKDATKYAIAVWSESSNKSFCFNLLNNSEDISMYSFGVGDIYNDFYFSYLDSFADLRFAIIKDFLPVINEQLLTTNAISICSRKDRYGSMFHCWTNTPPGTYSNTGGSMSIEGIGTLGIAGSISSVTVSDTQFYMSYNTVVKKGMNVIFSGSLNGNDGNYVVTNVSPVSINAVNDFIIVTVGTAFAAPEAAAIYINTQFQSPDGNAVSFCKSVAEKNDVRALSVDVLPSDILLARISWPGPVILNYIPTTGIGVNSDLFGMYGDIDVDWGATNTSTLTMTNGLKIIDLVKNTIYNVSGGSFFMNEGEALYVKMDGVNTSITPMVSPIEALPWALPIQVLGFVKNNEFNPHLFSVAGMGQLDVGEEIILGQDLDKKIRIRLGISSESSMVPYSSATVISSSDSYPNAISKLDQAFAVMMSEQADEFMYTTVNNTTTDITTDMDFDPSNTFLDITVYRNGTKMQQGVTEDYVKLDNQTIQFNYPLPINSKIVIRDERTGVPPVGGGTDLTNIAVDAQPVSNGFVSVGSAAKGFKDIYLKDKLSGQVYRLEISSGTFQIVPV